MPRIQFTETPKASVDSYKATVQLALNMGALIDLVTNNAKLNKLIAGLDEAEALLESANAVTADKQAAEILKADAEATKAEAAKAFAEIAGMKEEAITDTAKAKQELANAKAIKDEADSTLVAAKVELSKAIDLRSANESKAKELANAIVETEALKAQLKNSITEADNSAAEYARKIELLNRI